MYRFHHFHTIDMYSVSIDDINHLSVSLYRCRKLLCYMKEEIYSEEIGIRIFTHENLMGDGIQEFVRFVVNKPLFFAHDSATVEIGVLKF